MTARRHPKPTGVVEVPVYPGLDPVLTVGGLAAYLGVKKQLVAKWAREAKDWPSPFATPASGAVYLTAHLIEWCERHERYPGEGPREAGDPRPPSVRRQAV